MQYINDHSLKQTAPKIYTPHTRSHDGRERQGKDKLYNCIWPVEFQSVKQDGVLDCGVRAAVVALGGMRQRPLSSLNESGFIIHV